MRNKTDIIEKFKEERAEFYDNRHKYDNQNYRYTELEVYYIRVLAVTNILKWVLDDKCEKCGEYKHELL